MEWGLTKLPNIERITETMEQSYLVMLRDHGRAEGRGNK